MNFINLILILNTKNGEKKNETDRENETHINQCEALPLKL